MTPDIVTTELEIPGLRITRNVGVALGLAQLWGQVFAPATFVNLAITDGAPIVVAVASMLVMREGRERERLRKDRHLG